jgi:dTDP-4-dehydrorhamnose 3,5-epimerase
MNVEIGKLEGILVITPRVFVDDRGWFKETYQSPRYSELGIPELVQQNVSLSKKGVIRGLHYQREPHAQGKLVQVLRGAVWDVVVDIRESSPTYGQWEAFDVSAENHRQVWIPPGFAHGFQALEDDTLTVYGCSNTYEPRSEQAIDPLSLLLSIPWPCEKERLVGLRDSSADTFRTRQPAHAGK